MNLQCNPILSNSPTQRKCFSNPLGRKIDIKSKTIKSIEGVESPSFKIRSLNFRNSVYGSLRINPRSSHRRVRSYIFNPSQTSSFMSNTPVASSLNVQALKKSSISSSKGRITIKKIRQSDESNQFRANTFRRQHCDQLKSSIIDYFSRYNTIPVTTKDYYTILNEIGKGASAKVYRAQHRFSTQDVAIKIIEKSSLKNTHQYQKFQNEISLLKELRHPNIIQLYEVYETDNQIMIVMEYASGGNLLTYLIENSMDEDTARYYFKQILESVKMCHAHNVLHRDLKLDNLLLTADHKTVKLCDFGISLVMKESITVIGKCGTPAYMAPEILLNKGYSGLKADIWSLGVIFFALVTNNVPFMSQNTEKLNQKILKCEYKIPEDTEYLAADLIQDIFQLNPNERPDVGEVCRHPWTQMEVSSSASDFFSRKLNKKAFNTVMSYGYPKDWLINSLMLKETNHATACYYILLNSKIKN